MIFLQNQVFFIIFFIFYQKKYNFLVYRKILAQWAVKIKKVKFLLDKISGKPNNKFNR
jgi:hypothetical protein